MSGNEMSDRTSEEKNNCVQVGKCYALIGKQRGLRTSELVYVSDKDAAWVEDGKIRKSGLKYIGSEIRDYYTKCEARDGVCEGCVSDKCNYCTRCEE